MKKNWFCSILALLLAVSLLGGCGSSVSHMKSESAAYAPANGMAYDSYDGYANEETAPMEYEMSGSAGSNAQTLPANRKWVITMDISAESENLEEALSAVFGQIQTLNGYVESQHISNGSGSRKYRSASLTVRIPADKVDVFVQELNSCTNITSNSRNVKDITLAYADTEGRLKALRTEETRLLELLAQAETMSDLLEIEDRLTHVRYQLESYTSQLRVYDNQVDYATIDLYLSQVEQYTPVEKEGFLARISKGFRQSVKDLGEGLVDFAVWLIVDLPYLALWALIFWVGMKAGRFLFRKKGSKVPKEKKPLFRKKTAPEQEEK